MRAACTLLALVLTTGLSASVARAQWKTQDIDLRPGWNAVFLEVQPEPAESDLVFAGLPVESVWTWNREFRSVEFVQDASTLVPTQEEWLAYFPSASDPTFLTSLFSIRAGRVYLIEVAGSSTVRWSVTGKAVVRPTDWLPDSYNLVGFPVDPASPPTFASYFAPSPALAATEVYRLNAAGEWEALASLSAESIEEGRAYWVRCDGSTTYPGPVSVELEQGRSLDFGRVVHEQTLRVRNETLAPKQITLRPAASAPPPPGAEQPLAGPVALSYWETPGAQWAGPGDPGLRWRDFTGPLQLSVPPLGSVVVRVAVRRSDMAPPPAPEARYQSLLELVDGEGSLLVLPVVSRGMDAISPVSPATSGEGLEAASAGAVANPRAGLWVGTATVQQVSWAAHPSDKATPRPTNSEMQIRLIVHVDAAGQARLLQNVTMMWKQGTRVPDPGNPSVTVVDEPGRYVLVTREDLMQQLSGAALRDGVAVGRRISSAAFSFRQPIELAGSFGGSLDSGAIALDFDDPLNPFKHKYHPDHDNLDYDFSTAHPEGRESYSVVRNIDLQFEAADPEGLQLAGWGDTQVGGSYAEQLTGLHRETLYVEGEFRLHQVSRIPLLNDGL